ncbi:hypothetical protein EJK17_04535 [Lactobacillus xujianguonis]|uniref:Uncharacterized protein n=2 Tax=Lactobacillus TaxID=1578 RepID=A0A437SVW4_9LACO|nr:hypothetical protein [Lactobacillus xujianguonis]RVU70977.1 hypothetical protein EJK17_04535 [Lactobacillus xujianguonis]RVU73404.1 hypothetical protein EJK20_08320 [Lactobacillus xujianguonis]
MDAQDRLNRSYQNSAIYTSGFYADPEDELNTHTKLFDSLKSLTMNQHGDTQFSLQIMTTNSEINVMPLGLVDLNDLKEYEDRQRAKYGLNYNKEDIPLLVQFSPHTEHGQVVKKIIGTTQDLFGNFNEAFPKIWHTIRDFLKENQKILTEIEADLIADSHDVKKEYFTNFSKMSADQRKEALGFALDEKEIAQFATYMADMHEVQAIVLSAASFSTNELLGKNLFADIMNDNVRRSTLFWVLDNTFYEIFYYFYQKYATDHEKMQKYLRHHKDTWIVNMRNDAFHRAQEQLTNPKNQIDFNHYFTDIFIPVAQQLATEITNFKDQK